jgi:flavodoxin
MSVLPDARLRSWAKQDNSKGQPDKERLDRARAFSRNVMKRLYDINIIYVEKPVEKMKIEYFHASKYGNGAVVAEEFNKQMASKGVTVNVHHVRDVRPEEMPSADLYLFSSPGRFGKPIGDMSRFIRKVNLTPGTKYAVLVTELCPKPNGIDRTPSEEELGKCQRVIPVMNQLLQEKGLVKVTEGKIFVTGLKGPLEEDWQNKVEAFASQISILSPAMVGKDLAIPASCPVA